MNDTDVVHTPHRLSRGQRLIVAWRGVAQLGMLLDGRAHTWTTGETARSELRRRKPSMDVRAAGTPRFARLAA